MSERTLQALRGRINARLQTSAISRDRASAAGREVVALCRQSDVETLEWVLSEIDALLRTPRGEGGGMYADLPPIDRVAHQLANIAFGEWAREDYPSVRRELVQRLSAALTALRPEAQGEVWREVDDLLARLERYEFDTAGESEEYWRVVTIRDRIAAEVER